MCHRGQERQPLTQGGTHLALAAPPPQRGHTLYLPTVVRPPSVRAADAREAFCWQIVFSRWFLEAPGGILQTGFDDLFFTGEWVTHAAQSYTNRWDGGFPWLQALLSSVEGPTLKKIWIFIYLIFKHFFDLVRTRKDWARKKIYFFPV